MTAGEREDGGMRAVAGLGLSIMLLAGCAAPSVPRPGNTTDARMTGQFFYNCTNGDRVEVRFFNEQGIAVLIRGSERKELQRQPTNQGFIYSEGSTSIMGNGERGTLTIQVPGLPPLSCQMER